MLSKTISFKDFDGNSDTTTLYFNLTETELLDNMDLESEIRKIIESLQGEKRDLTFKEIQPIINLVKRIIAISVGVRSSDGKRFRKDGAWEDLRDSAAYNALLLELFQNPEQIFAFVNSVMPAELVAKAREKVDADEAQATMTVGGQTVEASVDDTPAWIREDRDPTKDELRKMTPEQLQDAFRRRNI